MSEGLILISVEFGSDGPKLITTGVATFVYAGVVPGLLVDTDADVPPVVDGEVPPVAVDPLLAGTVLLVTGADGPFEGFVLSESVSSVGLSYDGVTAEFLFKT